MNILDKIGNAIGLHPQFWLDWTTCSPDWIVSYCWWLGLCVSIAYFSFSVLSLLLEKQARNNSGANYFFIALSIVFAICSASHFIHVHAKYEPESMVLMVFLYPILVASMLALIPISVRLYLNIKNQIKDNQNSIEAKNLKIKELNQMIREHNITQSSIDMLKMRLSLMETMESASDDYIIIEGQNWEIPIRYDRWTKYKIGNVVCRLIGVYLNDESTMIINEFPECEFPFHQHYFSENVVLLKGSASMNDQELRIGESAHFKSNVPHNLKTTGCSICVVWDKKMSVIKGEN